MHNAYPQTKKTTDWRGRERVTQEDIKKFEADSHRELAKKDVEIDETSKREKEARRKNEQLNQENGKLQGEKEAAEKKEKETTAKNEQLNQKNGGLEESLKNSEQAREKIERLLKEEQEKHAAKDKENAELKKQLFSAKNLKHVAFGGVLAFLVYVMNDYSNDKDLEPKFVVQIFVLVILALTLEKEILKEGLTLAAGFFPPPKNSENSRQQRVEATMNSNFAPKTI